MAKQHYKLVVMAENYHYEIDFDDIDLCQKAYDCYSQAKDERGNDKTPFSLIVLKFRIK